VVQLADHHQVLEAGEQGVDGGVLGGEADAATNLGGVRGDVEPGHHERCPRSALDNGW
jgi:hypothetical protein